MPQFSVKRAYTIIVAVLAVLIIGAVALTRMQTDLLPDLSLPYVVVVTAYPGATPEEVEETVTRPIESAMATLSDIENITSTSSESMSIVTLEFNDSANMDTVTIDTREKLDQVKATFTDDMIGTPSITKISMDMLPVAVAAVDVDGYDITELTKYIEEEIVPELEGISGVAGVSVSGGIEKTQNVVLNEEKIEALSDRLETIVSEQMDELKKELDEAQAQLEEAKAQMDEQSSTLSDGQLEASQQILEGKLELLKMEIQLSQSESDITSTETQIGMIEGLIDTLRQSMSELQTEVNSRQAQLSQAESELAQNQAAYNEKKAALDTRTAQIEARLAEIDAEKSELQSQLDEANKQLAAGVGQETGNTENSTEQTETSDSLTSEERRQQLQQIQSLETQIAALDAERTQLESEQLTLEGQQTELYLLQAQITAGEAQVSAARQSYEQANQQLVNLQNQVNTSEAELASARTALAEAKAAVEQGQTQVSQSKNQVDEKEKEANSQIEEAGEELTQAQKELETSLAAVEEQLENFEATKKQALEAVDLKEQLTVENLSQILAAQNFSMPAGYAKEDGVQTLVRVGDTITDEEELEQMILFDTGEDEVGVIRLSDVADVYVTDNSAQTYAKVNQNDALILSVEKQNNYATAEVAHRLQERWDAWMEEDENIHFTTLMDQGQYIDVVVDSVAENLIVGAVLAILVLIFFLKDIRPTIIIAFSIPISVVFAIILMYFTGITLNIISLSGLAVGVGMLVDNSVVVIENIYRLRSEGVSKVKAAVTGAAQVAGAITSSTLTTVCVFLPIVFVEGLTRELFVDMALTIAYSLMASLIVALTLVPMMASRMLRQLNEKQFSLMEKLQNQYTRWMEKVLKYRFPVLGVTLLILIASVLLSLSKGMVFMPTSDSTQVTVSLTMPEGTELADTMEMSDTVMARIMELDDVDTVGAMLGTSLLSLSASSDSISMYVVLDEDKENSSQEVARQINEACADLDCTVEASGSASMDMSALTGSGICVRIKGKDLDELTRIAQEIAGAVEEIAGTENVSDGVTDTSPELSIHVDKEKAMAEGLTVAQIYMELANLLEEPGTATTAKFENEEYPIVVSEENQTMTPEEIKNYVLTVTALDGTSHEVKLSDVAEIEETQTLTAITREEQVRYLDVTAEIADGYNVTLVGQDVQRYLDSYALPDGYSVSLEGENETIRDAMEQLIQMLLLALVCIYFIMVAQFQSFGSPFIVMFTIPLAFTGGFLGLYLTGNELSVIAMIGFVMLSGVVVNNGIVLVDYINQLRLEGVEKKQAIVEAGVTRMRPIFMTAITTILGLVGMAAGNGMGADMMAPVAIVTIGGLSYATIMTLFIVPILYDLFTGKKMRNSNSELYLDE